MDMKFGPLTILGLLKRINGSDLALEADKIQKFEKPRLPSQLVKYTVATVYSSKGSTFVTSF